jgi:integrase
MAKKRGNNAGTIYRRRDGRWEGAVTIGRDPATGKMRRTRVYGRTRQEAGELLARTSTSLG